MGLEIHYFPTLKLAELKIIIDKDKHINIVNHMQKLILIISLNL